MPQHSCVVIAGWGDGFSPPANFHQRPQESLDESVERFFASLCFEQRELIRKGHIIDLENLDSIYYAFGWLENQVQAYLLAVIVKPAISGASFPSSMQAFASGLVNGKDQSTRITKQSQRQF